MGIEEGIFWDEHWVLYGNQFDNKFHILKKKNFILIIIGSWSRISVYSDLVRTLNSPKAQTVQA